MAGNDEQVRYWSNAAGPVWVELRERLDRQTAIFGDPALDRAAAAPGERVLDVGCGCGATSLELARRVGRTGGVLGVDVSGVMLDQARAAAADAGLTNVDFAEADAQTVELPAVYDLAFSRFGIMFFSDPVAAFTNIRRALRPGGRLTFVCWQTPGANPWLSAPGRAAADVFSLAPTPAGTDPGPFSLADSDRVSQVLEDAGFSAIELSSEQRAVPLAGAADVQDWIRNTLRMGPAREPYEAAPPELQEAARAAVLKAMAPYLSADGLQAPGAAWIVAARA